MPKKFKLCVIGGDGIGPELLKHALVIIERLNKNFEIVEEEAGFAAFKKYATPLPEKTIAACKAADAILFAAVTTPPHIKNYFSPIVRLRKLLNLYANVRPFYSLPIKNSTKGIDFIIVRENTEDLYSGVEKKIPGGFSAERIITKKASERIISFAFNLARKKGRKKVTVIHKANVLRLTDGLFLESARKVAQNYPDIELTDMLVDSCALQLIKNPAQFDIIVTTNMFGDILSDEASALVGGLGVVASANIGASQGLFEPVHGSAPKYTGQDKINPLAMLISVTMMLEYLKLDKEAWLLKKAITRSMKEKIVTYDLGGKNRTSEVIKSISNSLHA